MKKEEFKKIDRHSSGKNSGRYSDQKLSDRQCFFPVRSRRVISHLAEIRSQGSESIRV